jgi:hypothetical protein
VFLIGMASVVALTACSDEPAGVVAENRPEDALRGFYTAVLRDQDYEAACAFASPRFHLKPSGIVGANVEEANRRCSFRRTASRRLRLGGDRARSWRGESSPLGGRCIRSRRGRSTTANGESCGRSTRRLPDP